jgi:hypothetical protein
MTSKIRPALAVSSDEETAKAIEKEQLMMQDDPSAAVDDESPTNTGI